MYKCTKTCCCGVQVYRDLVILNVAYCTCFFCFFLVQSCVFIETLRTCQECLYHWISSFCPYTDCYESFGENYQGEQSRTRSNLPCAPWRDHSHRSAQWIPTTFQHNNFPKLHYDVQNRPRPLINCRQVPLPKIEIKMSDSGGTQV